MKVTDINWESLSVQEKKEFLKSLKAEKEQKKDFFDPNRLLYQLSSGQKWLMEKKELCDESFFHIPCCIKIIGTLNEVLLRESIVKLIKRHKILKTKLVSIGEETYQEIIDEEIPVHFEELIEPTEEEIQDKLHELSQKPFDKQKNNLVRVNFIRINPKLHYLLFTIHRVIFDNISATILYNELPRIYKAELNSEHSLPEIKSNYANFINWQEEIVLGSKGEEQKKFWQKKMSGKLSTINFPIEKNRTAIKEYRGKDFHFKLNKIISKEIKQTSIRENVNTSSLLMSVFKILLAQYTKQEEIIVMTPYAGRSKLDFLPVVGNFTNYLPLRSFIKINDNVQVVLQQLQKNFLESLQHGDYPFREIVNGLNINNQRQIERTFRIAFSLSNWKKGVNPIHLDKDHGSKEDLDFLAVFDVHKTEAFDLFLEVTEINEEFHLVFKYNASCLEEDVIKEMVNLFNIYISSIVKDTTQKISQLSRAVEEAEIKALPSLSILQERGMVPLSFSQEKYFLLQSMLPESGQYNIAEALRIKGKFDSEIVKELIAKVLGRYEIVRSTFWNEEGTPVQLIMPECKFNVPYFDLQELPELERYTEVRKRIEEESWKPFNILECPLFRVAVYTMNPDEHIFLLVLHPIIADYRSISILLEDFVKAYHQKIKGEDVELSKYRVQFADYAAWGKKIYENDLFVRQLNYWRKVFSNAPDCIQLPTDFKRPDIKSGKGANISFEIDSELTEGIILICRRLGVTPFMVTLSALYTFLNRQSGENDICIGTPYENRNFKEIKRLMGNFENTLALRIQSNPKQSFKRLLLEVKSIVLNALNNSEVPFEKVIDTVKPTRSLAFSPLFQVAFQYRRKPLFESLEEHASIEQFEFDSKKSTYDLDFILTETTNSFKGVLNYSTDIFEEETARQMVNSLKMILAEIVKNQDVSLSDISFTQSDEKNKLLKAWGSKKNDFKVDRTIHGYFLSQAINNSQALAVTSEEREVSYRYLDETSNQIARLLIKKGLRKGEVVAIYMQPSIEAITVILGILKAGGCCLPLDPKAPDKRNELVFDDVNVHFLIKETQQERGFDKKAQKVVSIDIWGNELSLENNDYLGSNKAMVTDKAFMYYVSGPNGKPKGMEFSHAHVMRLFKATEKIFQFQKDDIWVLLASISHISFLWEMLGALLHGGKLVIVPPEKTTKQAFFYELLESNKVTFLNCSPSRFKEFMKYAVGAKDVKELSLKNVILTKEPFDYASLTPWFEKFGDSTPRIYNMYGLTETSGCASFYQLNEKDLKANRGSIIGKPLEDLEFYILDKQFKPQPVGVSGEIYVGGAGVVSGYLKRPVMNTNRFLPNPFSTKGEKMYKTGDYGKWNRDGNIEILGRKDEQVNIDGARIELRDIETNLQKYKGVVKCAVIADEISSGKKILTAFLQVNKNAQFDAASIKTFLADLLPEEMIPSQYIRVPSFITSASGNIRKNLLTIPRQQLVKKRKVKSLTYLEDKLIEIWRQSLNLKQVQLSDNFFELCNDSIKILLISDKGLKDGLGLTPQHIFANQTVEELSVALLREFPLISEQREIKGVIPLVPGIYDFFEKKLEYVHLQNESILVEVPKEIHEHVINEMFDKILAHHDILRSRFHVKDNEVQHEILAYEEDPYFLVEDFSTIKPKNHNESFEALAEKIQHSLDINKGSLVRVCFILMDENSGNKVLLVAHSSLIDRFSWHILLEDFMELCRLSLKKRSLRLSQKTTSYKRWSRRIQALRSQIKAHEEIAYWKKYQNYKIVPIPREMEVDRDSIHHSVQHVTLSLDSLGTEKIFHGIPETFHVKPEEMLLSALLMTFKRFWNLPEIYLDYYENERIELFERQDLSRTVGNFYSSAPLVLKVNQGANKEDILRAVQEEFSKRPLKGMSFSFLKYTNDNKEEKLISEEIPQPEIAFVFDGEIEEFVPNLNGFEFVDKPSSYKYCGDSPRHYMLNIQTYINCRKLYIAFIFNDDFHTKEHIGRLAGTYIECLNDVIKVIESPDSFEDHEVQMYTPAPDSLVNKDSVWKGLVEKKPEVKAPETVEAKAPEVEEAKAPETVEAKAPEVEEAKAPEIVEAK
ncbi:MAG: amino acid adenylation domain-containing protein, partial [Nitrospinae bacterium]|nr:amino acid adenylation domain-containing protein [Nitrospinota bacterium]